MILSSDPLFTLLSSVRCPSCGTIESKGTSKCPECGLFHSALPLEDRKVPDSSERPPPREIDPSAYSLSASAKLVSESFDETNEIRSWTGGNTDFSELEGEPPLEKSTNSAEESG